MNKPQQRYTARAPSNIAFLKYWGRLDEDSRWPAFDSLSMTLEQCYSETIAQAIHSLDIPVTEHRIVLEGQVLKRDEPSSAKLFRHLDFLCEETQQKTFLSIETFNTFPKSAGIASSASGFLALTLASLAALTEAQSLAGLKEKGFGLNRIARLARKGSGSAYRSIFGGFVHWDKGTTPEKQKVIQRFSAEHWPLVDMIVICSTGEKPVGSSEAHQAAWSSPLFRPRLEVLPERLAAMLDAIEKRSMTSLGPLLETEALEMHAVMMTAEPKTCYLLPKTLQLIAQVRKLRLEHKLPVYFTIDAGPNVHLIGEIDHVEQMWELIHQKFGDFSYIIDRVGHGPTLEVKSAL